MSARQSMSAFLGMILLLLSARSALGHIHPGICVTKNGTLVVVHYDENEGKVLICRSTDSGKSWSQSVPIPGIKNCKTYPGALTALSDGRILVTWNSWNALTEGGRSNRRPHFSISSDEGKTWSEPRGLPTNPDNYQSLPRTSETDSWVRHSVLELSPNEWLIPASNKTVVYRANTGEVSPWAGGNQGAVPILRSAKGTLISGAGRRSTDQGKTWKQVKPFPPMNYGSDMIALTNGYLVAVQTINDMIIQLVVSRDDAASWDMKGALVIHNSANAQVGRPHLAQIDQDNLGVVFPHSKGTPEGSGATLVAEGTRGSKILFLLVPLAKLHLRGK